VRLWVSRLGFVLALTGCGGAEHFATLGDEDATESRGSRRGEERSATARPTPPRGGEGALAVLTESGLASYLTHWSAVVTDATGRVVAGADAERDASSGVGAAAPELRLVVPEGDDYGLELTASTSDAKPTSCRASIGPLRVEAGTSASVRVLSWDCGGPTGYVPNTVASECFWLADWLFVSRTRAAVGQDIEVAAAGHDVAGELAHFEWSVSSASLGRFSEPRAARTSFRCLGRGEEQALTVAISDDECQSLVSQTIACE
jgi:hypothetical protein